jgi:hypothetical protein
MTTEVFLKYSDIAFVALCALIVVVMARKNLVREFPLLAGLLSIQAIGGSITVAILFFRQTLGIEIHTAYKVYFYSHWFSLAAEGILRILIVYSVFSLAMKPLQGLHQIGKVIFRWVAAVSVMVSAAIAIGPHFVSPGYGMTMVIARLTGQIEQGISVLTLCLLLFVCFSTKPLGLTYRSRLFGITLGLGVMATVSLVQAAWFSTTGAHSLYSPIYLFGALGATAALSIWATYFILPEPERKLILLPTTSPFFFWNKISEALGDAPGHVAIAGFRPDMLAPAEMQMLSAPSMKRIEQPTDISLPAMPAMLQSATSR